MCVSTPVCNMFLDRDIYIWRVIQFKAVIYAVIYDSFVLFYIQIYIYRSSC